MQILNSCSFKRVEVETVGEEGGIGWKLITLALVRDPWKSYLMFLSRETDLQLCQIYTKINIYIQFCIKVVGLKRSNSENMQPIWKRWYLKES